MKVAFTLCSLNYLAQAKTLGKSLQKFNPDYKFIIGLVDRATGVITPEEVSPFELTEVEAVPIEGFEAMLEKYNIVELNTAVKPFFAEYILAKYPEASILIYFDPDIMVFHPLTELEEILSNHNFALTPHMFNPVGVHNHITEKEILRVGIYNLGFIGMKRSAETIRMLKWWQEKLSQECFNKPALGLYVDQKWMNLAPIYFKGVYLINSLGYNVAFWNLHERALSQQNGKYFINQRDVLIFYHFSSFDPAEVRKISPLQKYYTLENRPDVKPVYELYRNSLLDNEYQQWKGMSCYFVEKRKEINRVNQPFYSKVVGSVAKKVIAVLPASTRIKLVGIFSLLAKKLA